MTLRGVGLTDNLSPRQPLKLSTCRNDATCRPSSAPELEKTEHSSSSNLDEYYKLKTFLTYNQRKNNMLHNNAAKRFDESTITSSTSRTTKSSIGSHGSEGQRGSGSSRMLHHRRRTSIRVIKHPEDFHSSSPSITRSHGDMAVAPPRRLCSLEAPKSEDSDEVNEDKKSRRKGRSTSIKPRRESKSKRNSSKHDRESEFEDKKSSRKPSSKTRRSKSLTRHATSKTRRSSRIKQVRSLSYDKSQDEPTSSSEQFSVTKSPQSRRGSRSHKCLKKSILQLDPANIDEPSERSMTPQSPRGRRERKSDKRRSKSRKSRRRETRDNSTDPSALNSSSKRNSSGKHSAKLGKDSSKKKGKASRRQKGDEDDKNSGLIKSTKNKRKIKLRRDEDVIGLNVSRHDQSITSSRHSSNRRSSCSRARSRSSDRNNVPERLTRAIDRSSMHGSKVERAALAIFMGDDDDDDSVTFNESLSSIPTHLLDPANIPLTLQW